MCFSCIFKQCCTAAVNITASGCSQQGQGQQKGPQRRRPAGLGLGVATLRARLSPTLAAALIRPHAGDDAAHEAPAGRRLHHTAPCARTASPTLRKAAMLAPAGQAEHEVAG